MIVPEDGVPVCFKAARPPDANVRTGVHNMAAITNTAASKEIADWSLILIFTRDAKYFVYIGPR